MVVDSHFENCIRVFVPKRLSLSRRLDDFVGLMVSYQFVLLLGIACRRTLAIVSAACIEGTRDVSDRSIKLTPPGYVNMSFALVAPTLSGVRISGGNASCWQFPCFHIGSAHCYTKCQKVLKEKLPVQEDAPAAQIEFQVVTRLPSNCQRQLHLADEAAHVLHDRGLCIQHTKRLPEGMCAIRWASICCIIGRQRRTGSMTTGQRNLRFIMAALVTYVSIYKMPYARNSELLNPTPTAEVHMTA